MFWQWLVLLALVLGAIAAFGAGVPQRMRTGNGLWKLVQRGFSKDVRHPVLMGVLGLAVVAVVDGFDAAWGPIVSILTNVLIFAPLALDRWRRTSGSRRPAIVLRGVGRQQHAPEKIAGALEMLADDLREPFDGLPEYLRREVAHLSDLWWRIEHLSMDDLWGRIKGLVRETVRPSDERLKEMVSRLEDPDLLLLLVPLLLDAHDLDVEVRHLRRHILKAAVERAIRTRRWSRGFDVLPEHENTFATLLILLEAGDDVVDVLLQLDSATAVDEATRDAQADRLRVAWADVMSTP